MLTRARGRSKDARRGRRGAGTVRRTGKSWQARWVEDGERRAHGGFSAKDDAVRFLQQRADGVRLAAGLADLGIPKAPTRPKGPPKTFAALVDEWFDVRKAEGNRMANEDRWRWDRHARPFFDGRVPESVESKDLHRWVSVLRNPDPASKDVDGKPPEAISGATAERVVHLLSAFYRWAIREGHATRNPCRGIKRDAGMAKMLRSTYSPDSSVVLQSRAEVELLYRAIPIYYEHRVRQSKKRARVAKIARETKIGSPPVRAKVWNPVPIAYLISALAGLRPGEVLPLEWADVDLDRKTIMVRRNYRNGEISLPKSGKGRQVPIVPYLHRELTAWREKIPTAALVCPPLRNTTRGEMCFLGMQMLKKTLDQACDSCGITRGDFYDLGRRTFATLAGKAGLSPYRLKEIMGHRSIETTMRYIRFTNELTDAEVLALDLAS
jgi:integrase